MMKKTISLFEIYLLIMFSVSFSYMVGESNELNAQLPVENNESGFIAKLRAIVLSYLSQGLVSAQNGIINTCLQNVNGTRCQEYSSGTCNSICTTNCFPGPRSEFAACNLGTCYDSTLGTCTAGSPQFSCQQAGGQWSAQQPAECNRECCLINPNGQGGAGEAQFTTNQHCSYLGSATGAPTSWVPVQGEIECLLKANSQAVGACVLELLPELNKYNCKFETQTACLTAGGDFYENKLCTNPSLNTTCERTAYTKCFEDKDEVYFVDSCENKANIYDSSKLNDVSYWSNVVSKANTCSVGNNLNNQASCGNCNYLGGSKCGTPLSGDTSANYGEYICRDLSCVDEWGNNREQGESWCAFDGQIGVKGSSNAPPEQNVNPIFRGLDLQPGQIVCIANLEDSDGQLNHNVTNYMPPTIPTIDPNWTITSRLVHLPRNALTAGKTICSNETYVGKPSGSNDERSVALPGSESYKRICFDGEVRTERCSNRRTEVCVQNINPATLNTAASCRLNTAMMCLALNDADDPERVRGCEENSDCFLKHVGIDRFQFDMCVPKIPLGNYHSPNDISSSEGDNPRDVTCAMASQRCTYMEKKGFGGWKCKINCGCKTATFTETMNNLCVSLGDCGGNANLNRDFTHDGYTTNVAFGAEGEGGVFGHLPKLSVDYIAKVKMYATSAQGQSAGLLNYSQVIAIYGNFNGSTPELLGDVYGMAGAIGILGQILGLGIYGKKQTAEFIAASTVSYLARSGITDESSGSSIVGVILLGAIVAAIAIWGLVTVLLAIPVIGWILAAILIFLSFLGFGKTRLRSVEFKCLPWQPPVGGEKCDLCNSGNLPCTKYKCETFGKTCRYLNEGSGNEECVNIAPNDVSPPTISVNQTALSSGLTYNTPSNNGITIKSNSASDGCLKEYSPVTFGISLDEPGQCKISETDEDYEEMGNYFPSGSNLLIKNHVGTITMPTLDSLGISGVDPARRGDYRLYIRCQDASGNVRENGYAVQFCVSPADDHTPPILSQFTPASPGLVGLNATNKMVSFYTNEPATCRWSLTAGQEYHQMTNEGLCANELFQAGLNGWSCLVNLPVQNATLTNYYFKCADQPWLGTNETNPEYPDPLSNVNLGDSENRIYQLKKTENILTINSITPLVGQIISAGSLPVSVNLQATTSGGINNGNALCSYEINAGGYSPFFQTGGNTHTQTFSNMIEGNYNIGLQCTDLAQNTVSGNTQFTVQVDSSGPLITRVYSSGASLTVITNEASTCAWSTTSCSFDFASGTLLSGSGQVHTTPYDNGITYRIKCKDTFGNVGTCMTASGGY